MLYIFTYLEQSLVSDKKKDKNFPILLQSRVMYVMLLTLSQTSPVYISAVQVF